VKFSLDPDDVAAIADAVVARMREHERGMVDQRRSSLGPRRHIQMVRRLYAAGDPGVAIVGRRYLATPAVIESELLRIGKAPAEQDADLRALAEEMGLRVVGGAR